MWQRNQSPPKEEADLERRRKRPQEQKAEKVTTSEAPTTTSAPVGDRIVYVNGIYAPTQDAGPSTSTGATRKEISTPNRAALPDITQEELAVESTARTEPMPLMSIAVLCPRDTLPADGKDPKLDEPKPTPYRNIALAPRKESDYPLFPFRYKTTGTRYDNLEPVEFDARVDPPPGRCFHCHSGRHSQQACPSKSTLIPICANCGRQRVKIYECPRCKKAHFRYLHKQAVKKEGKNPTPIWIRYPLEFSPPGSGRPDCKTAYHKTG